MTVIQERAKDAGRPRFRRQLKLPKTNVDYRQRAEQHKAAGRTHRTYAPNTKKGRRTVWEKLVW
jgi:hypothetical protein